MAKKEQVAPVFSAYMTEDDDANQDGVLTAIYLIYTLIPSHGRENKLA